MKEFSRITQAYIWGMIFLASFLAIWQFSQPMIENPWLLAAACIVASVLQIVAVFGATARSSYSLSWIIYAFMLVLEGPSAALIVVLVSHFAEWILERNRLVWYIQSFNISTFIVVVFLSGALIEWGQGLFPTGSVWTFLITVMALAVFTLVNHFLVALVIKLARGQTFAQSGVFGWFTLFLDYTLLCLGFLGAIVWQANPIALTLTAFVTFMLFEALKVPALERKTEIDPKTQLYNAKYFTEALDDELVRSKRFKRPLSLIMADLDLLRTINNTYGHLAGDVVLQGVASILQEMTREYDIVARFGGEEFSVLLPETKLEDAYIVAERMRKSIAETAFEVSTSLQPIRATMSFGIASRQGDKETTAQLIHNADLALYRAKDTGRNRVCVFDEQFDLGESANQRDWAKLDLAATMKPVVASVNEPNGRVPVTLPESTASAVSDMIISNDLALADGKDLEAQADSQRTYPSWATNLFIITFSALTAVFAYFLVQKGGLDFNWPRILFFAAIVLIMEAASIEIYVKDTTVSTSAALMVAGVLLFHAPAAIILGLTIAFVSFAKRHIKVNRFLFNSSNHVFGGLLVVALLGLTNQPLESWSLPKLFLAGSSAAAIIFISTTALLTTAISLDSGLSFKAVWLQRFRWLIPYYLALGLIAATFVFSYLSIDVAGILIVVLPLLLLRYSQKQYIDQTETLVHSLRATNFKLTQQADEITRLNEEMLLTLARSLDLRDPHVMEHSKHVSRYAVCIAEEMNLPAEQVENIRKAGLLHDIGKLGVPEEILFKPGRLTAVEYEFVKRHTTIGADLIKGCHSLESLVPFILYHHEWFDGNGYPAGLVGDEIPLEARILSVADAVEAMASDRPYKAASSPDLILEEVNRCIGTQFDPVVVKALSRIIVREGATFIVNSARNVKERDQEDTTMYPPHY